MDPLKKLMDVGNHALTAINLLTDSPEVEPTRDAVVSAMRRVGTAFARVTERRIEADEAKAEHARTCKVVKELASTGGTLLLLADASLADELQSSGVLSKSDPILVTETLTRIAHCSPNKYAKAIGDLFHRALSQNAGATKKEAQAEVAVDEADREAAFAALALTFAAKQAETLIRNSADEHSPALKHVKRRYTRKGISSPAPTNVPAQAAVTPLVATTASSEPVVVPLPVTAANEPATVKAETDPKAA